MNNTKDTKEIKEIQLEKEYTYKYLESFYDYTTGQSSINCIDDSSWHDLNMNEVYSHIDWTVTSPGEQFLYKTLRTPLLNQKALKDRSETINALNKEEIKKPLRKILKNIGRTKHNIDVVKTLNHIQYNKMLKLLCTILPILNILNLIALIVFFLPLFIINAVFLFVLSLVVHFRMEDLIANDILFLSYLHKIIHFTKDIALAMPENISNYKEELEEGYKKCKVIRKKSSILTKIEGLSVISDYLNIFFFIKERNFYKVVGEITKNREDIMALYTLIGEIDFNVSISYYRDSVGYYAEPEFVEDTKTFKVSHMIHPLLEDPVDNAMAVHKNSVVITGSNMSGKSTFLRTIGVNVLMAQTICTTLTQSYQCSLFNIITSISLNDNVLEGKSFYLSEAEAIKRIIESSNEEVTCLALIDEIFKGTNPVERINAAAEILNHLSHHNVLTFVATHDLQLIPMLDGYGTYYFKEDVSEEEGMIFDYKIKEGISSTRNAIKILEYLNYPKEITDRINKRILESEKNK
ncbi:MutS-like protein [Natranaerovirga hydrolytica]|uniref:MutS-like protein n=1 Tax=Natranaerovirga hydrolytica TaxID=680378 RepID=A0A4R1N2G4_9FIRM|nr:DNA mismatch repair protein MutS [Natranaerovirga hydrolytica]TCK98194.1 MutS-like protein [Natranaerovirga hydrolytica]